MKKRDYILWVLVAFAWLCLLTSCTLHVHFDKHVHQGEKKLTQEQEDGTPADPLKDYISGFSKPSK